MLQIILSSLEELLSTKNIVFRAADRINFFRIKQGYHPFTRKDYLRDYKEISPATASRDLKAAVKKGIVKKEGTKRTTKYLFK